MGKIGLGMRLFIYHILVMIVALTGFIFFTKLSSPRLFVLSLERLEKRGFLNVRTARTYLIQSFHIASNQGTFGALITGGTAAGLLSYWLSRRIMKPLNQMKSITYKFAAGDFKERIPGNNVPELNQLAVCFNVMANSIEEIELRRRELVSDLSHELRTPLTVMRGYLEELADERIEPTPELYGRLIRETRRLERLIHDLQELSKAEAGYLSIDLKPLNLYPLLKLLLERFADQLLDEGPILTLDCPDDLPLVLADSDRTEQILVNLLGNAIRYTQTGSITLKAWTENQQVWVAVIDTGVGIRAEDLPHIFERFWRADSSRSRESGGTGIGLAITHRLVELQGGIIKVESQVNQGSTFKFSLPVAEG